MSQEVRLMTGTTGTLLLVSALALLIFTPAVNIWPWILLFASTGTGLMTGFIIANDKARATRQD